MSKSAIIIRPARTCCNPGRENRSIIAAENLSAEWYTVAVYQNHTGGLHIPDQSWTGSKAGGSKAARIGTAIGPDPGAFVDIRCVQRGQNHRGIIAGHAVTVSAAKLRPACGPFGLYYLHCRKNVSDIFTSGAPTPQNANGNFGVPYTAVSQRWGFSLRTRQPDYGDE